MRIDFTVYSPSITVYSSSEQTKRRHRYVCIIYDPLGTTVLITQVDNTLTLDLTALCSNPGYCIHIYDIFLPVCWVSTQ